MSISSTITITTTPKKSAVLYPCLRRYRNGDFVVLFTEPRKGTVVWVKPDCGYSSIGFYSEAWIDDNCKWWTSLDPSEEVILKNNFTS